MMHDNIYADKILDTKRSVYRSTLINYCEKNNLPAELIVYLLDYMPYAIEDYSLTRIKTNFYILYRYFSLIDIRNNITWLTLNSNVLYSRIKVFKEHNMDLKDLFKYDFIDDTVLNKEIRDYAINKPVDDKLIKKYEFIYHYGDKVREKELNEYKKMEAKRKAGYNFAINCPAVQGTRTGSEKKEAKTKNSIYKTIYDVFSDYDESLVDSILNDLSDNDKKTLYYAYGEDYHKPKRMPEWKNEEVKNDYSNLIKRLKVIIPRGNKIKLEDSESNIKVFYDYFEGYSKKEIDDAISSLDTLDKDILKQAYGKDLLNPMININWLVKNDRYVESFLVNKVKYEIERKRENAKENKRVYVVEKNDVNSKYQPFLVTSLYTLFGNFSKSDIDKAILMLDEKNLDFLKRAYGGKNRNLRKHDWGIKDANYLELFHNVMISKLYLVSQKKAEDIKNIQNEINDACKKETVVSETEEKEEQKLEKIKYYRNFVAEQKSHKRVGGTYKYGSPEFVSFVQSLTVEDIHRALNEKNTDIISSYYGLFDKTRLSIEEISIKYNKTEKEVETCIKHSIFRLNILYESSKKSGIKRVRK